MSSPAICSGSTGRPAIPTAASPRWTTCSRACRQRRCLLAGLGRVVQDLLLWCTAEFGYLRLADGFVQSSSIMPQKRNPVALEHARAIASKALGQASAMMLTVHNTPFGDIVDTEDDLQPLVAPMFRDARRAVALVGAAMRDARVRRGAARSAGRGRRHHADRAGRPSRARARDCLRSGARDCARLLRSGGSRVGVPLAAPMLERVSAELLGASTSLFGRGAGDGAQRQAFRRGPPDGRRARAGRNRARARQSQQQLDADRAWLSAVRTHAGRRRVAPPRTEPRRCDGRRQELPHRAQSCSSASWSSSTCFQQDFS